MCLFVVLRILFSLHPVPISCNIHLHPYYYIRLVTADWSIPNIIQSDATRPRQLYFTAIQRTNNLTIQKHLYEISVGQWITQITRHIRLRPIHKSHLAMTLQSQRHRSPRARIPAPSLANCEEEKIIARNWGHSASSLLKFIASANSWGTRASPRAVSTACARLRADLRPQFHLVTWRKTQYQAGSVRFTAYRGGRLIFNNPEYYSQRLSANNSGWRWSH